MDAGDAAGSHEVLQNTVRLDENMLAVIDLYLFAHDRIDEGEFGQFAVIEFRQGFEHLFEGRFANEHTMENAICGIGFGVLFDSSAGERSVADVHGEEQVVDCFLAVHRQDHVLALMLHDRGDETEEVVDVVRTDIVFERVGFLAAEGINAEADRVDEIAVVGNAVSPVGDAADVDRMSFALEETPQALFMVLGEEPEPTPVVSRSARHESHLDFRPLLGVEGGSHDAVDHLGEGAIAAEDEDLVIPFLHQLAGKFRSMTRILRHPICERQVALAQQFP